jgi:undecaprenyl-diphosphatase
MTNPVAVVFAIVEGLTEFLPVSSTGHMIIAQGILQIQESSFTKMFLVNIQFGAILAVLVLYYKRFLKSIDFYKKLLVAFIPAAVLGLLLNKVIDNLLESVVTVAFSLIIGGVVILWADRKYKSQIDPLPEPVVPEVKEGEEYQELEDEEPELQISYLQALIIGCFQTIAMIPGVSRSAATIIGGLTQKLRMKEAAEFSFFLAVPTIAAAAAYKTMKGFEYIKGTDMQNLIIGNVVAFIVAVIAIKYFITFITQHGMKIFGYYRILLGVAILIGIYVLHLPLQILK